MGHNSVGIGYNFYYLFLFLLVLFIFEISPRNKLQPPTDTQSPHSGKKSTMSTASFLTFATLLVLMTLSWSQPGKAAPNADDGHPKRAASQIIRTEKMFQSTVWALCLIWMTNAIGAHAGGKTPAQPRHPCDIKNGGCSQICGRVGNKAICSCKGDYWLKNDKKSCKKLANPTDYVMVTSEDGTAYASSELSTTYKADKAFGEDGYWVQSGGQTRPFVSGFNSRNQNVSSKSSLRSNMKCRGKMAMRYLDLMQLVIVEVQIIKTF